MARAGRASVPTPYRGPFKIGFQPSLALNRYSSLYDPCLDLLLLDSRYPDRLGHLAREKKVDGPDVEPGEREDEEHYLGRYQDGVAEVHGHRRLSGRYRNQELVEIEDEEHEEGHEVYHITDEGLNLYRDWERIWAKLNV
jgi:hypothetical protein